MALFETPSRVLRRIQDGEAHGADMPSLPSLPNFSDDHGYTLDDIQEASEESEGMSFAVQSTPALSSTTRTTIRATSVPASGSRSTNVPSRRSSHGTMSPPTRDARTPESLPRSAGRSPHNLSARTWKPSLSTSLSSSDGAEQSLRKNSTLSESLLEQDITEVLPEDDGSPGQVPNIYMPPFEEEDEDEGTETSLTDALQSLSRSPSPTPREDREATPMKKNYDYSVSLRSELVPTPLDPMRHVQFRRPLRRTSTPSLSRTTSPSSSSARSTPVMGASLVLREPSTELAEGSDPQDKTFIAVRERQAAVDTEETLDEMHPADLSNSSEVSHPDPTHFTPVATLPGRQLVPHEDMTTPKTRRRSFLLDVINSSVRPRLKAPTPHPLRTLRPPRSSLPSALGQPMFTPVHPSQRSNSPSPLAHDQQSFISTASSHDLTMYQRANASFDPSAATAGRFNTSKLNTYLHGLNRRLQEENLDLQARVEQLLQQNDASHSSHGDENAEQLDNLLEEKQKIEEELEDERTERQRDKERWMERMQEVESGVEGIIKDLEGRLNTAEENARKATTDADRQAEATIKELREQLGDAEKRVRSAEDALTGQSDVGRDLRAANDRIASLLGDIQTANARSEGLQDDLQAMDERTGELQRRDADLKDHILELEDEVQSLTDRIGTAEDTPRNMSQLQAQLKVAERLAEGETQRADEAQSKVTKLAEESVQVERRMIFLEEALATLKSSNSQMEDAFEESEAKLLSKSKEIASLHSQVESLERDVQRERTLDGSAQVKPTDLSLTRVKDSELEALESELDDAHKEIARLSALLEHSPARKAVDIAKDTRIEMLEREKENLFERMQTMRDVSVVQHTPQRRVVSAGAGVSPLHRKVLGLRTPRTPGTPLKDMSWLQSLQEDRSAGPILAHINELQDQLEAVNQSLDHKLDQLEDAGMGAVQLIQKFEDAHQKIVHLQEEVARLERREERRNRRLQKLRCSKCLTKVQIGNDDVSFNDDSYLTQNTSLPSNPATPPTRTSKALQGALESVNVQLDTMKRQWDEERSRMLGEKAVLQDATNRLNIEVKTTKQQLQEAAQKVQQTRTANDATRNGAKEELDHANNIIAQLEGDLQSERNRICCLTAEHRSVAKDKSEATAMLKRTEMDMNDIKEELQRLKKENYQLEKELRENANADHEARMLEVKLSRNQDAVDQMRHERSVLATEYSDLQHRFAESTEHTNKLRKRLSEALASHDRRRHELDMNVIEIDDLKAELTQRAAEQQTAAAAERQEVDRNIAALEGDLQQVRQEAAAFGRDLRQVSSEKAHWERQSQEDAEKFERLQKQSRSQIRLLNEQLDCYKERLRIMDGRDIETALSQLRAQHKLECKGLIVQITYLKAKFVRENTLRRGLGFQKEYILVLLSRLEKSEKDVLSWMSGSGLIIRNGTSQPKRKSLKAVVNSMIFVCRARRAAQWWREQCASKPAIAAALHDVRRRRVANS